MSVNPCKSTVSWIRKIVTLIALGSGFQFPISAAISIDNIDWVIAQADETHVGACSRAGLNPLFMDTVEIAWNQTTFDIVVADILERNVSSLVSNSFGIYECCAPSLWCISGDGCFTQGYGSRYNNYGWLNNNTDALPVYTCMGVATVNSTSIVKVDIDTSSGTILVLGSELVSTSPIAMDSTASSNPAYAASIAIANTAYFGAEVCSDVQLTNCLNCTDSSFICPLGTQCYHFPPTSVDTNAGAYCLMICAGPDDLSCPTGSTCSLSVSDDDDAVYIGQDIYLCQPVEDQIFTQECALTNDGWRLYCAGQRGLQPEYLDFDTVDGEVSFAVTIRSENSGIGAQIVETEADDVADLKNGFCETDSVCFDGNVCTSDTCGSTGFCEYTTIDGCNSILSAIQGRAAPYMYYSYSRSATAGNGLDNLQNDFVNAMLLNGNVSTVTGSAAYPLEAYALNFSVVYFGNKVDTIYVSSQGAVALPPVMPCTLTDTVSNAVGCTLFAAQSNVIAPFFADWNTSAAASSIRVLQQINSSTSFLGSSTGIDVLHVLFNALTFNNADSREDGNTFAVSIYSDSSVKLSYISVNTSSASSADNYLGLWGAFTATGDSSYLRYHAEVADTDSVTGVDNSEINYCSFPTIGCIQESCLAAGEDLQVQWPGGAAAVTAGCLAMGAAVSFSVDCSWAGGLATTTATLNSTSDVLTCAVPCGLDFSSGSIITVDVSIVSSAASDYSVNVNDFQGTKSVFGVMFGAGEELTRTPLMVRYFSTDAAKNSTVCGCSALSAFSGATAVCDVDNVCNSAEDSSESNRRGRKSSTDGNSDCFGTPFGSAIANLGCSECAGGLTGVTPDFSCLAEDDDKKKKDDDDDNKGGGGGGGGSDGGGSSAVSLAIILLMLICCMTFVVVAISYSVRRMLLIRSMNETLATAEQLLMLQVAAGGGIGGGAGADANAGLTEFECDALGEVVFSKAFYMKHQAEQERRGSGAAASTAAVGDSEAKADAVSTGAVSTGVNAPGYCDCAICLCEIEEQSICRVLPEPCGHVFHKGCIDQWFKQSNKCPMCKRSMRKLLLGDEEAPPAAPAAIALVSENGTPSPRPTRFPSQSPSFYNRAEFNAAPFYIEEANARDPPPPYDSSGQSYNNYSYHGQPPQQQQYTTYSNQQYAGAYHPIEADPSPAAAGGSQHYFSYISQQRELGRQFDQHPQPSPPQRRTPPPEGAPYGYSRGDNEASSSHRQHDHSGTQRRTPPNVPPGQHSDRYQQQQQYQSLPNEQQQQQPQHRQHHQRQHRQHGSGAPTPPPYSSGRDSGASGSGSRSRASPVPAYSTSSAAATTGGGYPAIEDDEESVLPGHDTLFSI